MESYSEYLRGLAKHRRGFVNATRLQRINEARVPAVRQHIENGGKYLVELGCGTGEFAARLAERTQRWVIGIEAQPEQVFYSPLDYEKAERFLCLNGVYGQMTKGRAEAYSWLFGSAQKTFVVMPFPASTLEEELAVWLRLAAPGGELHIRTEAGSLRDSIRVPSPHRRIPFAPEAEDLPSFHSRLALEIGRSLYSFGIKLL